VVRFQFKSEVGCGGPAEAISYIEEVDEEVRRYHTYIQCHDATHNNPMWRSWRRPRSWRRSGGTLLDPCLLLRLRAHASPFAHSSTNLTISRERRAADW
jgi:hypothetical protein